MKMKRMACALSALIMMLSLSISAAPAVSTVGNDFNGDTSTVAPKAEETEWYYRVYNGHLQRRLWSYTRGIWLTEWEDC